MTLATIDALVAEHHAAKSAKHFLRADQIRDELIGAGITITKTGWEITRWRAIAVGSVFGCKWPIDLTGALGDSMRFGLAPALDGRQVGQVRE